MEGGSQDEDSSLRDYWTKKKEKKKKRKERKKEGDKSVGNLIVLRTLA
jgi:hypothetical protein